MGEWSAYAAAIVGMLLIGLTLEVALPDGPADREAARAADRAGHPRRWWRPVAFVAVCGGLGVLLLVVASRAESLRPLVSLGLGMVVASVAARRARGLLVPETWAVAQKLSPEEKAARERLGRGRRLLLGWSLMGAGLIAFGVIQLVRNPPG